MANLVTGAETFYQFFHGAIVGSVWSMVTPYPPPGSAAAMKLAASGTFRAAPPLALISTMPTFAIMFGSVFGCQRLATKTYESWSNSKDSFMSKLVGLACSALQCYFFLSAPSRAITVHNRIVGGAVISGVVYANLFDLHTHNVSR